MLAKRSTILFLILILRSDFLQIIQLEPFNVENEFERHFVGLVNDTLAMLFSFFYPFSTLYTFKNI